MMQHGNRGRDVVSNYNKEMIRRINLAVPLTRNVALADLLAINLKEHVAYFACEYSLYLS